MNGFGPLDGHFEPWYYAAVAAAHRLAAKKAAPVFQHQGGKEVKSMYSEYGYIVDGVEYATVEEALEAITDTD